MAGRSLRIVPAGFAAALLLWSTPPALAQLSDEGVESTPLAEPAQSAPTPRVPAGGGATAAAPQAATGGEDQSLRRRVEQLEEQLVDLQVVIGTLESLARSGGVRAGETAGPIPPSGFGGSDQARLEGIETQIRALTAQLEQLSNEVRAQAGPMRRSEAGDGFAPAAPAVVPADGAGRFGSTTVTSDSSDPIAGMIGDDAASGGLANDGQGAVAFAEPSPEAGFGSHPKQIYERAYGFLLQKNYGAAQSGFSEFLKKYPKDPQAPDALYWLGEAHYVQRNYADAAEAFDLVTASFASSSKAPDAQLKRAMSLAQLGKKQDACSAFRELDTKYPDAPGYVKSKADSERQRTGCP